MKLGGNYFISFSYFPIEFGESLETEATLSKYSYTSLVYFMYILCTCSTWVNMSSSI